MANPVKSLFDSLPNKLFRPLAGKNNRLYWGVLERLFDDFFKGNVFQYINGVPKDEVISSIARQLENLPHYILDDEDLDIEAIQDRSAEAKSTAYNIYRQLVFTGWLTLEKDGYREFILLHPTISQLLHDLTEITISNPVYYGGKVQAIYNTVSQSKTNPKDQASAFHQVCSDSRNFFRSLNGIVVSIRDIHSKVTGTSNHKDVLDAFYIDFVKNILVADYKKLKTENHPFRYRSDILNAAQAIQYDDDLRSLYIQGYMQQMDLNETIAVETFNNDVSSLISVFSNVDLQLERIDNIKDQLEKRVSGLIRFMGRTSNFELSGIKKLIKAIENHGKDVLIPLGLDEMGAESDLYKPKEIRRPPEPKALNKAKENPWLLRKIALNREAIGRRYLTPKKLTLYLAKHIKEFSVISSDDLTISSIDDFCAFVILSNLSIQTTAQNPAMKPFFHYFKVVEIKGETTENTYVIVPKFTITKLNQEPAHAA